MAPKVAPQESATPGRALEERTRILRRTAHALPWTRLAFSLVMREISGDHSGGETPVPIPNTAVKPTSADGTALATGWESRSLPGISLLFSAVLFDTQRWAVIKELSDGAVPDLVR